MILSYFFKKMVSKSAKIGFKKHRRTKDDNIPNENVFITYEVTADDILQLSNSVQLNGADNVPATKEAQTFSTDVVEIVSYDADETWPCNRCDQVFPTKLALATHKNIEHAQAEIDEHFKTLAKRIGIPELYVCNVCNVAYQQEAEIEKHMEVHEKEFQNWPCNQCDQVFFSKHSLGTHRNAKHGDIEFEKPTFKFDETQELYVCNICSAEYQNQTEVEKHLKTHENNFKCTFCNEKFKKAYDLGTHSIIHYDDNMFRCPLCKYKTPKRGSFSTHINHSHSKNPRYICKFCGKGFLDSVLHKEHEDVHLGAKPFTCVVCKKAFIHSRYLIYHQNRVHRVDTEWMYTDQCTICKAVFRKPAALKKHVQIVHKKKYTGFKRYLCDVCGKLCAHQADLTAHYRTHTGNKPFSCTYCNKNFIRRDNLIVHERVHSGEKPFACEYCGKCFSQRPPFKIHQRQHTGERPYECQFCTKKFVSRGALNMHSKSCKGEI